MRRLAACVPAFAPRGDARPGGRTLVPGLRTDGRDQILCVVNLGPTPTTFNHQSLLGAKLLDTGLKAKLVGGALELPAFGAAFVSMT